MVLFGYLSPEFSAPFFLLEDFWSLDPKLFLMKPTKVLFSRFGVFGSGVGVENLFELSGLSAGVCKLPSGHVRFFYSVDVQMGLRGGVSL